MKKALKKILSLLLCIVFAVGLLPMTASAKTITQYSTGDTFEFGWYPQSEVTDTTITSQLNAQAPGWDDWTSYGYCIGTGTRDVGTGDSYTVKEAKKSYTLVAKYMQDGAVLAESEIETVTVKNGFFDKLKAFFRALFKKLPVLAQAFVGVETI